MVPVSAPEGAGAAGASAVAASIAVPKVGGLLAEDLARQRSEMGSGRPLLRIEDVSVHFGGLKAVSEVSFEVKEGSITALIGPNGAGKTTLFNAVSRLQETAGGRVWFGDIEVTKLDAAETARLGVARTFQNMRIFVNMSVLENVLVGCHRHEKSGFWAGGLGFRSQRREEKRSRERAMDALALVGLADRADVPASSLPYGQQRLVEIARALASEPRLLLLDEPAAGTNQSEREALVRQIAVIRDAGVTVLLVEHDIDLVMDISDTVNVLDYGKLIASGTPEQVQRDQKVITAYLGAEHGTRDLCSTRDLVDGESCPVPEELLVVEGLVTSYGSIEALHGVSSDRSQRNGGDGPGRQRRRQEHPAPHDLRDRSQSQRQDQLPGERHHQARAGEDQGRRHMPGTGGPSVVPLADGGRQPHRGGHRSEGSQRFGGRYRLCLRSLPHSRRTAQAGSGDTLRGRAADAGHRTGSHREAEPVCSSTSLPWAWLRLAVERIFEALAKLNEQGLTMLMVEQNAEMALSLAHLGVVLQTGIVVLSGTATQLRQDDRVRASYLGGDQE